jgi:GntR family transcriptional regulator
MPSIDRTSDRPVYRQIADQLRQWILSEAEPGAKLPSERELSQRYDASRVTVRQAIALLRAEGLIDVEHGAGVFVRSRPPVRRLGQERLSRRNRQEGNGAFLTDLAAAGREPSVQVDVRRGPAPADIADRLGVPASQEVLIRDRVMGTSDGQPLQLAISYLPLNLVEGTQIEQEDTGPGGTYARLEEVLEPKGRRLAHFREDVSVRMPLPEEAVSLRLAAGVPVIRVVRTAFDDQDTPLEVCDTLIAGDRYELTYDIPNA